MEKRDARLLQQEADAAEDCWNSTELESRRHLRHQVDELIRLVHSSSLTTSELHSYLHTSTARFGTVFALSLVHALHREDAIERQSIVWLLIQLNDPITFSPLQCMSRNERLPRALQLSAALALAGLGTTTEMSRPSRRVHLYAIC